MTFKITNSKVLVVDPLYLVKVTADNSSTIFTMGGTTKEGVALYKQFLMVSNEKPTTLENAR